MFVDGEVCVEGVVDPDGSVVILPRIEGGRLRLWLLVVAVVHVAAVVPAFAFVGSVVEFVNGPPLPPRIVARSSLAKLELRMEKYPPSKPVAPAVRAGSWTCCLIFALVHSPWSLRALTKRSC